MLTNAVIIEDERKGLVNLKHLLGLHCPDVTIIGEADGVASGKALLGPGGVRPDLAFLDITLSDGKVFQLLDAIKPVSFDIIFVTAYDRFAIKACEYASMGYILKPIDPDRLAEAVARVEEGRKAAPRTDERLEVMRDYRQHPNSFNKLSVVGVDGIHFTNLSDVVHFQAADNYTEIHLTDGQRIMASKTLMYYDRLYSPYNFYRIHKGHLINLNFMRRFVKGENAHVVMHDGMKIEVSRRRRAAFMTYLRGLQGGM